MELKELEKLLKLLRKHGVKQYKSDNVELSLDPSMLPPPEISKAVREAEQAAARELSEEDVLFWSTNGIPEN